MVKQYKYTVFIMSPVCKACGSLSCQGSNTSVYLATYMGCNIDFGCSDLLRQYFCADGETLLWLQVDRAQNGELLPRPQIHSYNSSI